MTESVWISKEGERIKAAALRLLLLALPHGSYRVTVSDEKGRRSTPQNDRMHAMFRLYAQALNELQATGPKSHRWTMEEFKEVTLAKFAPTVQVVDPNGEIHERLKRSHELDVAEATDVMDSMEAWMLTSFGIGSVKEGQQEIELG